MQPLTVVLTRMSQLGSMNCNPMIEFELTVLPEGLPPYPVKTRQAVNELQIAELSPGQNLHAKADPDNPLTIWLELPQAA